jgi:hypothetical protein
LLEAVGVLAAEYVARFKGSPESVLSVVKSATASSSPTCFADVQNSLFDPCVPVDFLEGIETVLHMAAQSRLVSTATGRF